MLDAASAWAVTRVTLGKAWAAVHLRTPASPRDRLTTWNTTTAAATTRTIRPISFRLRGAE